MAEIISISPTFSLSVHLWYRGALSSVRDKPDYWRYRSVDDTSPPAATHPAWRHRILLRPRK